MEKLDGCAASLVPPATKGTKLEAREAVTI